MTARAIFVFAVLFTLSARGLAQSAESGLSREAAEALVHELYEARRQEIRAERGEDLEAGLVNNAGQTLRLLERTFGEPPEHGHSLWISMHGGGGAPPEVNDQQWRNQIRLYEIEEGIVVAPRAPTNTWNLWHQSHIDALFDRLIETYIATRDVDPNRVYLLGYSAGGDGVYQLAPRMADRFAAAAMMAGHPNDASPDSLRNLPFAIYVGGRDSAYNRNTVAEAWAAQLAALRERDPEGYVHTFRSFAERGHWMNGDDAEALPWMAAHIRNPWPRRVVWRQDDVTHTRLYWLSISQDGAAPGRTIRAEVDGQVIRILTDDVQELTLRLRDTLVDLNRPMTIEVNGTVVYQGTVRRTREAIEASLAERSDPTSAATAAIDISW